MSWPQRLACAAVSVAFFMMPTGAVAQTSGSTCDPYGAIVVNSSYIIQEGEFNSTANECISTYGTSFRITQSDINVPTNGMPGAFTSIYQGCHWGRCTAASVMPVMVSSLTHAYTSWNTTQGATGAWDATYDVWFNPTPTTSGQPVGAELMVALNMTGGTQPAGSVVGHAAIGGLNYTVWATRMNNCNYVVYRADVPAASANFDLTGFIRDATQRGYIQRSWYLIAIEAGFELWQGGAGLATNSFSVNLTSNGK